MTGAPSCGKTTIYNALEAAGVPVRREPATAYIESRLAAGETLEQICIDQGALQWAILQEGCRLDADRDPQIPYVLDRGAADPLAYCRLYGIDDAPFRAALQSKRYKRILLLDRLPYTPNHVRIEDEATAALLDTYLEEAYRSLGYEITRIPVMPIAERIQAVRDAAAAR